MDEYSILKKKQKKNAFAATALLISIAIALLVMVGAVLILSKVNDKDHVATYDNSTITETEDNKKEETDNSDDNSCEGFVKEVVFNDNIKNIKEAAISYFTNERLPKNVGDIVKITLKQMKDKKLVLNVRDSSAKTCDDEKSYVEVTKEDNEYVMKVFLSCSNMEDYIIVHLGCYDYCEKDVCEKETPKEYEYEYKKTTSCTMSDWSKWGNWKTTREKTSNLKKEDIKVEKTTKNVNSTIDATINTTYNCDKYPGYKLIGDKCVKEVTITDTKDATPSEYSYNCDKYPGYSLVGNKCVKETKNKIVINATANPTTYTCPSGYTLNGTKCKKTVTKTDTKDGSYVCPSGYTLNGKKCTKTTTTTDTKDSTLNCPSGYKLSGTKCIKTTVTTNTKDATAVYSKRTKTEKYTCYKEECTTTTVFSCPTGKSCGNYPQTSCEKVKKTCTKKVTEKYISGYKCEDGYTLEEDSKGKKICTKTITTTDTKDATRTCPSGYTLSGTKCTKTTSTTDTKDATFTCPSGYSAKNNKCVKTYNEVVTIDATANPTTYTCPSGYTISGSKCIKYEIVRDEKGPTRVPGGYVCPSGYTQNGKKCTKVTIQTYTKDAGKKVAYTCPSGYTKDNNKCTKKGTETIKTTYYRYATRTCNGGSTKTEWSTSKDDSILKSEGYKLTGNKREIIIK